MDTIRTKSVKPPFDSLTLRAVIAELREELIGGQVQDVRQPIPSEIRLGIRSRGRNRILLLSSDARFARVHLTETRLPNAPVPPTFCMTLRKHSEGSVVRDIRQSGFDRILQIEVGAHAEDGPPPVTLIAELMGKHSNLTLVNSEGVILDAAKRISHRVNRVRETLPGLVYQPPPEQPDRVDPLLPGAVEQIVRELPSISLDRPEPLTDALMQIFAGFSPFLAREISTRALADPQGVEAGLRTAWDDILGAASRGEYAPTRLIDASGRLLGAYPFPLIHLPPEQQLPATTLNEALDEAFAGTITRTLFEEEYNDLRSRVDRELQWLTRQKSASQRALEESGRSEGYKQTGELILANLWRIRSGERFVEVEDYYDPDLKMKTIELDSKRTPQENAELYFQRYRRALGSRENELQRGAQVEAKLLRMQAAKDEVQHLTTVEAIRSLRNELIRTGLLRASEEPAGPGEKSSGPDFQGHKIRRYTTPDGYEIYVGETATANDFLTTRVASPNDIWLHVRAAASAHVVIRTKGKPDLTPRTVIQRAAELCALHSAQKHSSLVSVDYTLKKYVRKPRGSVAGAADYAQETTIDVTPGL